MSLDTFVARYDAPLEAELRASLRPGSSNVPELAGMLRYHMGWADASLYPTEAPSGKRVRPLLCLLACEACAGDPQQAYPAAAALELLHNFSLVHDDIEDGDRTRRGRGTLWALWGMPKAINAGDALFAIAQLTILRLAEVGVPPSTVQQAARLFNVTCLAITQGQHLDIDFERREDVTTSDYLMMVECKTAALIASSCELGSLVALGDCSDASSSGSRMRRFGHHLGLAFQMQDDVLGIWGDPAVTGKPAGADLVRHKKSLPILLGLERSQELHDLLRSERLDEIHIARARRILNEVGSRDDVEALARDHFAQAVSCLEEGRLVAAPARALSELAHRLLGRNQ